MNVQEALEKLKKAGYKYTGKRKTLLELFATEKRYMSAKEILASMKGSYPGISFDTVYRNLSLFEELNIVEVTELEGEKRFRFNCSFTHHHHHVICMECGKTKQISVCPMDWMTENVKNDDFTVTGHKFEIYGCCADCQASL
ncbi:Fur family transcriptional regulator [Alteribacillus iranensis]|uniref:Zinc uptake regulator, Fur family n=1 Tax=Alteribacillus iranensis TaxID=930128 RepID=A0A1I1ZCY4_9BACI|nr:Fur family transcriptional regulator [Alteribacillus iranensis]SFE29535.1 zinc uptake regulator, Fur family [Alteribacillus iranensis]